MGEFCSKIVCVEKKPEQPWKLFFGDNGHFLRVDRVDYPIFARLYEKAFSDFWTWFVVDFSKDLVGFTQLSENAQRMFLLNNGYQTIMDSGVVNLYNTLVQLVSNTELALLYSYIAQNESIHGGSYSYGLTQMFGPKAEEKIDVVYHDRAIQQRLENEIDYSDQLINIIIKQGRIDDDAKKILLKTIVSTYTLEHLKFPFSFFTTWRINESGDTGEGLIQGFANLLKLIATDELEVHAPTNGNVLKILRRESRQGFKHLFDSGWAPEFIENYVKKVAEQELDWCAYLFEQGPINGFTQEMGEHFIKYYADKTLRDINMDPIFNEPKSDVIDWYEDYRNINNQNTAQQETSNVAYQKGVVKNDLESNLERFKKTEATSLNDIFS